MRSPAWRWPPVSTFSSTVISAKGRGIWKVRPTPLAMRASGPAARHVRAVDQDAAGGRLQAAGEQVEQRRLAGAVRADQAEQLAAPKRDRHAVDGAQAAETP